MQSMAANHKDIQHSVRIADDQYIVQSIKHGQRPCQGQRLVKLNRVSSIKQHLRPLGESTNVGDLVRQYCSNHNPFSFVVTSNPTGIFFEKRGVY